MKKLILSAVVALAGLAGVNAQSMGSLEIGAKASYNYSNLSGNFAKAVDLKGASGYNAGLYVEIPVTARLSIQPEVLYSSEGSEIDKKSLLAKLTNNPEFKMKNVNVPVLAKYYIFNGLNLQAGPQISFLTDSTVKIGEEESEKILKDALAKVKFGAVLGAGYKLPMGFSVDARYTFGFTNLLDSDKKEFEEAKKQLGADLKSGVVSVGIGYQF